MPSTISFQSQQPGNLGNISDVFSQPTRLFPHNVLIHFAAPGPDEFFAVHSGRAVLLIKPNDPSAGAPEVNLAISVPSCMLGERCNVRLGTLRKIQFETYRRNGGTPFVAQTVIAASYGLMQVLYTTAVDRLGYIRNGVGRQPSHMLEARIAIDLGTEFVGRSFREVFPDLAVVPAFSNLAGLKSRFGVALAQYNDDPDYPSKVLARSNRFSPTR